MRQALRGAARAFDWSADGGLAYNYTLLALCHRAAELSADGRLRSGADCAALAAALPGASAARRTPGWFPPALTKATRALVAHRRACAAAPATARCTTLPAWRIESGKTLARFLARF